LEFIGVAGIPHHNVQQETIALGFGQRVGTFLFDGDLRGQHSEQLRQPMRLASDRHLALLHGFE
jgi:hypothetical protein